MDNFVQAIVLVEDLGLARRDAEERGFVVSEGGRHPGRGTANLVIPFGHQYLELLAVVDTAEAEVAPQGVPVLEALRRRGPGLARWSVEAVDIDATAARLGEPVERRQRRRPDGVTVRWRAVGVDRAWAEPWRCAFMSWDDPATHPARPAAHHPNGATGFSSLEVEIPAGSETDTWMGRPPAGVTVVVGPEPGRLRLTIDTDAGPIVF